MRMLDAGCPKLVRRDERPSATISPRRQELVNLLSTVWLHGKTRPRTAVSHRFLLFRRVLLRLQRRTRFNAETHVEQIFRPEAPGADSASTEAAASASVWILDVMVFGARAWQTVRLMLSEATQEPPLLSAGDFKRT